MSKITNKIKLIGGMLSLVIATIVFITVYINHTSRQDSVVINVAGKQRMLTQKITKDILLLQHSDTLDFSGMDASILEFETTLHDLIEGNADRDIYAPPRACMKERLLQVEALWKPFNGNIQLLKSLIFDTRTLKRALQSEYDNILFISDRVVKEMVKLKLSGRYIDDSGRQRMLSQKIALRLTQYIITGDMAQISGFMNAYGLYESTLQGFSNAKELAAYPDLQQLLEENREEWKQYSTFVMELMKKQQEINKSIAYITTTNMVLMKTMDSAVAAYTKHSEEQRAFLQNFQYVASVIALLAMIYSARLTWKIKNQFSDFLTRSEAMAGSVTSGENGDHELGGEDAHKDELTLASMHMSTFVAKMNTVLEHAQQAIHESEQAAKELAGMTETIDDELDELDLDEVSKKDIDRTIDRSEDIVIQTLEELSGTSRLLEQLQNNLNTIISKTGKET